MFFCRPWPNLLKAFVVLLMLATPCVWAVIVYGNMGMRSSPIYEGVRDGVCDHTTCDCIGITPLLCVFFIFMSASFMFTSYECAWNMDMRSSTSCEGVCDRVCNHTTCDCIGLTPLLCVCFFCCFCLHHLCGPSTSVFVIGNTISCVYELRMWLYKPPIVCT